MPIPLDKAILLVDDMPTIRKVLQSILKQMGFTIFLEEKDGVDAMQTLNIRYKAIGLVIADWNMPNMTGIDMWREMKKDEKYKHIKFIMVSSENDKNHIVTALKEGVHNYILKPFEPRTIKKRIESL
ncbi:MAG: hypothetical protein A2381_08005 [Bdellovibrionales bacterium RIFOXYB1_FULL_37_110]|nr:MAG: hypothetical protein A2181_04770 [Bdellovibrionales bacterium RIFOXYA1_FULL_38_20]OFZ52547.1 MAG: hypothetical protein A2417_00725 [Bdellovibrionales bacterium RIFOXYC1_FULL_37_79]OFZ59749.1 MAG: hypothetical protein A2381_08005 [Bdellovibrionales bacterium RIFOXYB1_FULL_37_110]OFZ65344.1 MAG: hypothetical protein A2577_04325 [Bdellovibrionales bacterium RIFOXYD1_FULL_36_51]